MSKAESSHAMKSSAKVQLYHDILTQILRSLVELQRKGGLLNQFNYRGKVYNVLLFSHYLLYLVIQKVMTGFVADITVAEVVFAAYAVTATPHVVRLTMSTFNGNTFYLPKSNA
jgi:hypothetical protein